MINHEQKMVIVSRFYFLMLHIINTFVEENGLASKKWRESVDRPGVRRTLDRRADNGWADVGRAGHGTNKNTCCLCLAVGGINYFLRVFCVTECVGWHRTPNPAALRRALTTLTERDWFQLCGCRILQ